MIAPLARYGDTGAGLLNLSGVRDEAKLRQRYESPLLSFRKKT